MLCMPKFYDYYIILVSFSNRKREIASRLAASGGTYEQDRGKATGPAMVPKLQLQRHLLTWLDRCGLINDG